MSLPASTATCPHCGAHLQGVRLPDETNYDRKVHWACFNDECTYFVEGWDWMMEQYEAKASYRYRVEPKSGVSSPLPVWSAAALRDRIVDLHAEDEVVMTTAVKAADVTTAGAGRTGKKKAGTKKTTKKAGKKKTTKKAGKKKTTKKAGKKKTAGAGKASKKKLVGRKAGTKKTGGPRKTSKKNR
ncbi:MAG: hypothetical protein A2289_02760 [Deltaproteobacteria bacterium RIFOXYA12_FULL_58_15]|nr:MAG: hypothetical protein A2289_02760 [Deltaproteobacteria bacterium RIFOXYA12_FULL_58_15]